MLEKRCRRGLISRLGGEVPGPYRERLVRELAVINKLGYAKIFLKLAEIAAYIERKKIRVGPGRGPAPGSLVCWTLGITHLDPVVHGLLFERFLNLETTAFPMVELAVTPKGREQVLRYLKRTWGPGRIARVGCVGREVGPKERRVCRGVDSSAICLSDRPLKGQIPLRRDGQGGLVTEDEEHQLRAKGMFVFGIMPLRASAANQLNSPEIQGLVRRVKPENLAHRAAIIALFRPGPLYSGLTDLYIKRRHQKRPIRYHNLTLMDILEETYGLILYQEQFMSIAERLAGFSPEMADGLRKEFGRKEPANLKVWRRRFVAGCREEGTADEYGENGISKEDGGRLFDKMVRFGGYAFLRAHAVACAGSPCAIT